MATGRTTPPLILISGAPGSGKTTLGRRLAADLRLPFLSKDETFKEPLFDALGSGDLAWSRRLGAASFLLLARTMASLLDSGTGVLAEANWWRGRSEPQLAPLCALSRPAVIHLDCPAEVAANRYRARAAAGRRHGGHLADVRPYEHADDLFAPLDLPAPLLIVDSTVRYTPPYEHIRAFVLEACGMG